MEPEEQNSYSATISHTDVLYEDEQNAFTVFSLWLVDHHIFCFNRM
jgi:hypothetical protein